MATSVEQIMTRLRLNVLEITGIQEATEYPNRGGLDLSALPYVAMLPGAETVSMNAEGAWSIDHEINGYVYVASMNEDDSGTEGFEALASVGPFKDRFRTYFMEHPTLHTESLDQLWFLYRALGYRATSPGAMPGGGFVGFQFTLSFSWDETRG